MTLDKSQIFEDPPSGPRNYAIEFADPASAFMDAESVINGALLILTTELAKEPTLRKEIRHAFRDFGIISVRPTDLGATKIDEMHPYYAFKYLLDKPVEMFRNSPQFLQILAAETEGLVSVDIRIGREKLNQLTISIYDVYLDSTYTSDDAKEWNHFRERVIVDTLTHHLLPLGTRYIRDWLRDTEEDFIANRCASKLEEVRRFSESARYRLILLCSERIWHLSDQNGKRRAMSRECSPSLTGKVISKRTLYTLCA